MTCSARLRRLSTFRTAGALLLATPLAVMAQQAPRPTPGFVIPGEDPALVDRVVAVAGDSVIFLTDVQYEMLLLSGQQEFPTDSAGLRDAAAEVLESLVNLQLLLQEAARDSTLAPDPTLIESRVQEQIDAVQGQIGGAAQLQAALAADGMTMPEYRETLRTRIQRDLTRQLFLQRRLQSAAPVAITEQEMRELFDTQRASLQQRPEIFSLEQVLIRPSPPDSMWARARAEIDSLVLRILGGEDFEEVAREASDDPGSGANGGDLGWFRRGAMVPEFDAVAFRLNDGQMSAPFRSSYGWHVIRVDRRRPGEVKARHILVAPESGPDDLATARERALEISARWAAGARVADLARELDQDDRIPVQLQVSPSDLSGLPEGYAAALANVTEESEGTILPPFEVEVDGTKLALVRVVDVRAAGEFTFEDVEAQIRQRLQQQKSLERLWAGLRSRAYVDIRF